MALLDQPSEARDIRSSERVQADPLPPGPLHPTSQRFRLISMATYSVLASAPVGAADSILGGIAGIHVKSERTAPQRRPPSGPHRTWTTHCEKIL